MGSACAAEHRKRQNKFQSAGKLSNTHTTTYSEDEADGSHAGGSHDFGTVGDQVEEDRHGGLGRVVEAAAQHR